VASRAKPDFKLAPRTVVENAGYAARQLREAIVAGKLRPGVRLIEMELADQLSMSRHPIREALRELGREGFVEMRPNRGAVVAGVDAKDILEVYEIRAALGSLALRHLLLEDRSPTAAELSQLERMARKALDYAASGNQPMMVQHDLAFQAQIVALSGMVRAAAYFQALGAEIQRFINLLRISYPDKESTARREVLGLFEAIRDRNHPRADKIWRDKFTVAARRLVALIPTEEERARSTRGV
jgi:DNA-binding GntR family transcriptional regulator